VAFAIPKNSIGYWLERLRQEHVPAEKTSPRFDEELIRFIDPDGLLIELIESAAPPNVEQWHGSLVPIEHSIRGFHSVSAALEGYERTAKLLTESFGYRLVNQSNNRFRFASQNETTAGREIDLICAPDAANGRIAAGSVHHIAFRARDDAEQQQWRKHLVALGYNVTPVIDRVYFHSIYFREPGSILFEIATDPPGFTLDESLNQVGESLRLPPWLESARAQIETVLPPIAPPTKP
jgi:glyoxalase family protein